MREEKRIRQEGDEKRRGGGDEEWNRGREVEKRRGGGN